MGATTNTSTTSTPAAQPQRKAQFFPRLLSSLVLWSIVLLIIFKGYPIMFCLMITLVSSIALWEFYALLEKAGHPSFKFLGVFAGCVLISLGWFFARDGQWMELKHVEELIIILLVLGVFFRQLPQRGNPKPIETMTNTVFGILYIPWLLNFITKLTYLDVPTVNVIPTLADVGAGSNEGGRFFVLYLILVTKFSDVGAYVVGSLFGRHKLIPRISPNKTWEGAVGAVLVPLGLSVGMYYAQFDWFNGLHFTLRDAILLGVLFGFVAMIGDLAKSLIKRQAQVKDSGKFIPGIGGALDLVDSLLFTAPIFYLYLRLIVGVAEK
jgi:phosphatidate cytidylyltransferase